MKKTLCLLVGMLLALPTMAQSDDGEDFAPIAKEKKNAFFLGPKVGAVFTSMSQPEEGKVYDKNGIGLSGGLALKARFGKATENSKGGTGLFGVGLEMLYKQNTVKTIGTDEKGKENASLTINYFEVPIYMQLFPLAKSNAMNSLYVELGVSIAGSLGVSPKTLTVNNPSESISKAVYHFDSDGSKLKGLDVRPIVGLGYTIPKSGFNINARYYVGTSKLAENFTSKMNSFEVSVSWLFRLGK